MKYLLLILVILSSFTFAQVTNVKSGDYKLKTNGEVQPATYTNKDRALAAATKISNECFISTNGGLCRVDILQPTITVTTLKMSSSSSKSVSSAAALSSSSSLSSSASVSSSSEQSSSQSSSLPAMIRQPLSWSCPKLRVDETVLNEWDIEGYSIIVGDQKEILLAPTVCNMSHIVDMVPGEPVKIAAIAKNGGYSTYEPFN